MEKVNQSNTNLSNHKNLYSEAKEIASKFLLLYKKDKTFQKNINNFSFFSS
jgi:ABC-type Fe3+-citrate transport system substrate-binding protein